MKLKQNEGYIFIAIKFSFYA